MDDKRIVAQSEDGSKLRGTTERFRGIDETLNAADKSIVRTIEFTPPVTTPGVPEKIRIPRRPFTEMPAHRPTERDLFDHG